MKQDNNTEALQNVNIRRCSNQEIDEAFVKLQNYFVASENQVIKSLLYANLQYLSKEAIRRDGSLVHKLGQILQVLRGFLK